MWYYFMYNNVLIQYTLLIYSYRHAYVDVHVEADVDVDVVIVGLT